jgi:hypothetical protein
MATKIRKLESIYRSIKPLVEEVAQSNMVNPDFYQLALKAALAKSFDFNSYVANLNSGAHSFYHTATLRGLCEDLIVLKAIRRIPAQDRSILIAHMQLANVLESMKIQGEFFRKNRPQQPVISPKNAGVDLKTHQAKIREIYDRYGFLKNGRTTVKQLAKKAELLEVYEFFYAATSKWVHFSPQILMRMGWTDEMKPGAIYTFSTSHFSNYYFGFNAVYGTYLFALFCEEFADDIGLNVKISKYIEQFGLWLGSLSLWPEVATLEELNVKRPNIYEVMKIVAERRAQRKKLTK